jgi:SAM-dependent MidA family methyltransferase
VSRLGDRLRARIAADGPITFAAFMEAALYDPDDGFYARGPRIGRGGAFATVPTLVPLFTQALAQDLRGLWEALDRPDPFTVCELGPGDGTLAAGLADALADLPLELVLCERAAGLAANQRSSPSAGRSSRTRCTTPALPTPCAGRTSCA